MNNIVKLFCLPCCALLACCAVGPDYHRPPAATPPTFKEAKNKTVIVSNAKKWKKATPQDAKERGKWWLLFHDAQLNQLENELNLANQSIKNAMANYEQALALVDAARANFYPLVTASASVTRQKSVNSGSSGSFSTTSSNASSSSSGAATSIISSTGSNSTISTNHLLSLNASWEPDLWGSVRRAVEASSDAADASAAQLALTRLLSQASLAQYYFELRGLDADQRLLNKTVKSYQKSLALIQNQYKSGVAAESDILQAKSLLEAAQAQAINNGILRGQYEHAIAVLMGRPPAYFSLPARNYKVYIPPIPLKLPSALLERRPDIAQAERLMAQANAQIGVAVAAYYPVLSLSGMASVAGTGLAHWFSLPALAWAYGPSLTQTLFDGGLRNANVNAATSAYEATIATYRQTVLAALQEVEDDLISLQLLNKQVNSLNAAARDAEKALQILLNQYKAGTVAYSGVLTAQINAYAAEKNATDIDYMRINSAVLLIRALGGGYTGSDYSCS